MDMHTIETALRDHKHIALDFDGCLLNGSHSRLLIEYMAAHPEKQFSIITNRPGRYEKETADEAYGQLLLRGMPHDFKLTHIILSPDADLCGDIIDIYFKGKAASLYGATILVDDDASHRDSCDAHGVYFLHLPCDEGK